MTTNPSTVSAIGALADPIRRDLYEHVVGQHGAVSREEAAVAVAIPLSKAKFHLDRLVTEGLLDTEFKRLSGRQGPGAGRPAKLYRRASREFQASFPERRYDTMGSILAAAVENSQDGESLPSAIRTAAYAKGAGAVSELRGSQTPGAHPDDAPASDVLSDALATLAGLGYEPEVVEQELLLHNCPFDALAQEHRELVCSSNEHYVQGALDASGCGRLRAHFEPSSGFCCVVARPGTSPG